MPKQFYRVRNWSKYNKALIARGNITWWFDEDVIKHWYAVPSGKRGRCYTYSDKAIELFALLRIWFNKPLRATEGLLTGLLKMLKLPLQVPSYSQVSRRTKTLSIKLNHDVRDNIHVVVDGTGLKIYGEGEWKVKQHGQSRRRMWRKLHIGLDVASQEIVMMELTDNHIGENKVFPRLLSQYEDPVEKVGGDKAYDSFEVHEEIKRRGARSAVLIQRKARIRRKKCPGEPTLERDDIVRRMRAIGRKGWKAEVGYHKRSLVETAFSRVKRLFGDKLHGRRLENQKIEALLTCNLLNRFTRLGMPDSVRSG